MVKAKKKTKKPIAAKGSAKKTVSRKSAVKKTKTVKKPSPKRQRTPKGPAGLPEQLRAAALKVLDDRQAEDITAINLVGKTSMADYLIIASGRAARQIAAMAHYLRETFEKLGATRVRVEGLPEANWVLVDAGDVVVHLFRPEVRRYYDLDSIWKK